MRRRLTALAAALAALLALEVPLCAAACSGPDTRGNASSAVADSGPDSPPCHESSEPVEEHGGCGAGCLHQVQAASAGVDGFAVPVAPALWSDPLAAFARTGRPLPPGSGNPVVPPVADLLLLKSTLLL